MRTSIIASSLLPLLLLAACDDGGGTAAEPAEPPPQVTVATPLAVELVEWDEFTGRFEAAQAVDLRPRVTGYLERIGFADGALVETGDLLFAIDPEPFEAALDRARANVADAEARARLAAIEERRAAELLERNNVARAIYDQRQAELQAADAAVAFANAALREAEIDLAYTEIRAPLSGRISDRRVDVGELVSANGGEPTLLTTIVSSDPIHFVFDMSEAEYLAYQRAADQGLMLENRDGRTPAMIRLIDEAGWPHEGHLDFLDNVLSAASATIRARVIVDNEDGLFTPGLFARVRIPGSPLYPALLIPDEAVMTQQASRLVMVVGEDGTVEAREIRPGPREFGLRVVRRGLEPDERIVINGLQRARPGGKVTPVEGTIDAAAEQG
jgi:RND family efflux transporter MFP subunit